MEQIEKSYWNLTRRIHFLKSLKIQNPQVQKGIDITEWNKVNIKKFVLTSNRLILVLREEYFKLYTENQELKNKLKSLQK